MSDSVDIATTSAPADLDAQPPAGVATIEQALAGRAFIGTGSAIAVCGAFLYAGGLAAVTRSLGRAGHRRLAGGVERTCR